VTRVTRNLQKVAALRPVMIALVSGLLAVALLATIWIPLPNWLDWARLEIILLTVFGIPAALVAGRAAYRVALATLGLILAIAVQIMFGYLFQPECGLLSDLVIVLVFGPPWLFTTRFVAVGIVIVAPVFAYGVLSRASPFVRVAAVTALLVAVFAATMIVGLVQMASTGLTGRCPDF
jgi:hypothetical protein